MSSVHAGLSWSLTLAEVFFGNLAVVASFMFFCLSQRYHVRPFRSSVLLIRLVLYEPLELLPDPKQGHCQVGQDDRFIVVYGDFQLVAEVEFEEGVWLHFV